MAGAGSLDLAALFNAIHSAVQQFAPQAAPQFDQGIGQINQMLGINVQRDLLGALGPQWAYFIDPTRGGDGIGGLTLLNHPRDPARLEASITKVETFITAILHQQLPPPITLQIREQTVGGVNLHFIAAPFVSPAWAIKDGTWYAGFFPQVVVAAAGRTDAKSLLDNPAYQLMQKRLGSSGRDEHHRVCRFAADISRGVFILPDGQPDVFGHGRSFRAAIAGDGDAAAG